MGRRPVLNAVLDPFVQFLRPVPKIALIPLVVVWLGIGEESKFFLIFIATFLSVIVGATAASQNVPYGLIQAAQTMGLGKQQSYSVSFYPRHFLKFSPLFVYLLVSAGHH